MKKSLMLVLVTTFILTVFSGCEVNTEARINNRQEMTTRQFDFADFNKIVVNSAFEVEIKQGEGYSISITADDFSRIKVEKDGETLIVSRQGTKWFAPARRKPAACITLPGLESLKLSGATDGTLSNFHTNKGLTLQVSESSHLQTIDISASNLVAEISGASRLQGTLKAMSVKDSKVNGSSIVELIGSANDLNVMVSGSSRCNLINFPVYNADINVSGASDAWANLTGRLNARVSGASNLTCLGSPTAVDIDTSGSSYSCMHHTGFTNNTDK